MKCVDCNKGKMVEKNVIYSYKGCIFGEFIAEVCNKCGATYFSEISALQIEQKAKELGLWGCGTVQDANRRI